jgi:hypothetical protein
MGKKKPERINFPAAHILTSWSDASPVIGISAHLGIKYISPEEKHLTWNMSPPVMS